MVGFCIYFKKEKYSAPEFLALSNQSAWVDEVKLVLENWVQNKPFVFLSSGSTGNPKEFSFDKSQLKTSANATIQALGLIYQEEHILMCLSAKFVGGAMMLVRAIQLDCAITIIEPQWSIFNVIDENHPYTFASFVPMQLLHPTFSFTKYNRIKTVLIGGTFLPENLTKQLVEITNRSFHTYGMTETLSHVAIKEINRDLGYSAIPPNQIGINEEDCICIISPILKEELVTHDIAISINENQFNIIGRTDFIINSGGIKINPEVIEARIANLVHLPIKKRFVISRIIDAILGEQVVLVLEENFKEGDFKNLVLSLQKLGFKKEIPRQFRIIQAIPLTKNGKIDRRKIIEYIDSQ
jgi:O-succinylbenzoic acid--CoA ligase